MYKKKLCAKNVQTLSLSCKQFSTMSTQPNSTVDSTITLQDGEHEIILTMQKIGPILK